jgi:peptidoglycan/xylan/chitin deacetylase (PgdA/CDA1 family)
MTEEELREVVADGMEIGSHGWLHRNLKLASEQEAEEELVRSKKTLEEITQQAVEVFAYPYGEHKTENFEQLRHAGYHGAVTIFSHEDSVTTNPYAMRRIYVHSADNGLRFRAKLSKAYLQYRAWRDGKSSHGDLHRRPTPAVAMNSARD